MLTLWWIRRLKTGDIFSFQMSKLNSKIINEKLEEVFNKINSAKKNLIKLLDIFFMMSKWENIGFTKHKKKQYFARKVAFTEYESGFDYNPGKVKKSLNSLINSTLELQLKD